LLSINKYFQSKQNLSNVIRLLMNDKYCASGIRLIDYAKSYIKIQQKQQESQQKLLTLCTQRVGNKNYSYWDAHARYKIQDTKGRHLDRPTEWIEEN